MAATISISGSLGKTDVHVWSTVATVLRNAFIKSLVPKVDETVKVEDVQAKQ